MPSRSERFKGVRNVLWGILFLNLGVSAAKVFTGYLIGSVSVVADGFHSLTDGSSNVIGLVGIRFASRPADADHPYGHGKMETFSAIGIGGLLFFACIKVLADAYGKFLHPKAPTLEGGFPFIVLLVTLCINVWITFYESKRGRALQSDLLVADAKHTRSDIFVTISVLATLVALKLGVPPIIDPLIALVVAALIAKAGVDVLRSASSVLVDEAVIDGEKLHRLVEDVPGVVSCHRVRSRGRSDSIQIDLHVQLPTDMMTGQAHSVATLVEERVKIEFPGVSEVLVHIEPERDGDADTAR